MKTRLAPLALAASVAASCGERELLVGAPDAAVTLVDAETVQPPRSPAPPQDVLTPPPDVRPVPELDRPDAAIAVADTAPAVMPMRPDTAPPPRDTAPPVDAASPAGTIVCGVRPAPMQTRPISIPAELLAARVTKFLFDTAARREVIDFLGASRDSRDLGERAATLMKNDPPVAFVRHWLDVRTLRDAAEKELTPEVRTAISTDIAATLGTSLAGNPFSLGDVFTMPVRFTASALRTFYPEGRFGLLGHPAWLINHSNPTTRGTWIRERAFCEAVPPPPPDIPVAPGIPDPKATNRERWVQGTSEKACLDCHQLLDPQGFAFEHYDGIGRFRTTDNGKPVDASGAMVKPPGGVAIVFKDAAELTKQLATSCEVRLCFARQALEFALDGRTPASKEASARELTAAFAARQWDVRRFLIDVVQAEAFLAP